MPPIPSSFVRFCFRLRMFDVAAGAVAPSIAVLLRNTNYFSRYDVTGILLYSVIAAFATALSVGYFRVGPILSRYLSMEDVNQILKAVAVAILLTAVAAFSVMRLDPIPRSMPALHFLVLATLLVGSRALMREHYRKRDAGGKRLDAPCENILLVGASRMAWLYIRMLSCISQPQQRVVALLDDDPSMRGRSVCGHPVVGGTASLASVLTEYATHGVDIHRVLVTYTDLNDRIGAEAAIRAACEEQNIPIEILAERFNLQSACSESSDPIVDQSIPTSAAAVSNYLRFRRVVDIAVSGAAIVLLAPVFAAVAVAVLIDVGRPAIFWQERVGRFGRRIFVHKFRTLSAPVDRRGEVVKEEDRLSAIGRFLRATRLDELPQFFDILRGDMTLIGPRPLLPIDLPNEESNRLQAPPGLTGWAQVYGGKLITAEEKNALDEWYICHVSPLVDLHILRLTLLMPFRGDRRRERVVRIAAEFRARRLAGAADSQTTAETPATLTAGSQDSVLRSGQGRVAEQIMRHAISGTGSPRKVMEH